MSVEKVKSESIIAKKAYSFALDIIKVYKLLVNERKEYVLSKQLLRSGTSIGANINEGIAGQSKRDFVYKLNIALKEARETNYWLNLLKDSEYINLVEFEALNNKCNEIIKMLTSIIMTTKERYFNKSNTNS
jgi:four helix bundle protein